jgi:hypothetical protein
MPRFFERGDPAERQQRDLEAKLKGKIDQCDAKGVQLQAAETKLAEARTLVEQLALDADEAALDRALQAWRGAEDKAGAISAAIVKIGAEIADIESEIERVVDGRMRTETAAAVSAMIERFDKAAAAHAAATLEYEQTAKELGLIIPEGVALANFLLSSREQPPATHTLIVTLSKNHRQAVLNGGAKASLPQPEKPAPKLTIVEPPTKGVFAVRHLKYVAEDGSVKCCGRMRKHSLPLHLAETALASGAAWPETDPRVRNLNGTAGMLVPDPNNCELIGPPPPAKAAPKSTAAPVVVSSHFSPNPDTPPPYTIRVPTSPIEAMPMTGARAMDDE